ncbi:MAG: hypothetical protein AAF799_47605, partial [Myxococcota bacterium]
MSQRPPSSGARPQAGLSPPEPAVVESEDDVLLQARASEDAMRVASRSNLGRPVVDEASTRPAPTLRLSVELRIAGMIAALWWLGLVHALVWARWAGPPWRDLSELPWATLLAPHVLALGLVLGYAIRELPSERWPRR